MISLQASASFPRLAAIAHLSPHPVALSPKIKNLQFRGFVRDEHLSLAELLTNEQVGHALDVSGWSAATQARFRAVSTDVVAHGASFSVSTLTQFWQSAAGELSQVDVDAVIATVIAQSAAASSQELSSLLNQMQNINNQKAALRQLADEIHALESACATGHCQVLSVGTLNARAGAIQSQLDSTNEMSDQMSTELQMTMDRYSKLVQALSNVLKKLSDTSGQIIQNLK